MLYTKANLAVHTMAAKEKGRYALNGVLLAPDGTTIAADGSALMAVEGLGVWEPDAHPLAHVPVPADGAIVPADTLKDALKTIPKGFAVSRSPACQYVALTKCDGQIELSTTDLEHVRKSAAAPIEGSFPKYQEIIPGRPAEGDTTRIAFDAVILRRALDAILKATEKTKRDDTCCVELEIWDHRRPAALRARTDDLQNILVLVSPIIGEDASGKNGATDLRSEWELRGCRGEAAEAPSPPSP